MFGQGLERHLNAQVMQLQVLSMKGTFLELLDLSQSE
jgi:hypothetical protein